MSEVAEESSATGLNEGASEKRTRKRLRLSCLECRKKKLFCDRNSPCQRCVKSGQPGKCSFETVTGQPSTLNPSIRQQEQIRDLQAEVSELKILLSKVRPESDGGSSAARPPSGAGFIEPNQLGSSSARNEGLASSIGDVEVPRIINHAQYNLAVSDVQNQGHNLISEEPSDPGERSPRGYYSSHSIFRFFGEIRELFPFIRETASEWFEPLGIHLSRKKLGKQDDGMGTQRQHEIAPETLLPPKQDTDALVSFYLDHLEQVHRIVHIPTFRREYDNFWTPGCARHPAMTVLILAMISISACASAHSTSIPSTYRTLSPQWISTCDEWLRQQSTKHRRLVYYQISCLVYISKRMNRMGKKKKFWKDTASLIQDAIMDGLHCDASSAADGPYLREMKRRIWAVLRELDLHNSFESGLPSLLHNIPSDVGPPANLDDEDFDEESKRLPEAKPLNMYTFASYQAESSRSWSLRLEISQRLFSPRFAKALSYDEVLRYTHEVTQAMESIATWDANSTNGENGPRRLSALAHAYLQFQLKECIITLHRPYLKRNDGRFWLSETAYYQVSQDILHINVKLAELGYQYLSALREDLFLASLSLCRVILVQPRGSISTITNDHSAVDLVEKCLSYMEDIYLHHCSDEPRRVITVYAATSLIKVHLGKESRQEAKASCARRFLDLHYRFKARQDVSATNQQYAANEVSVGHTHESITSQPATVDSTSLGELGWLDGSYTEFDFDSIDFDLGLDNDWDAGGQPWLS